MITRISLVTFCNQSYYNMDHIPYAVHHTPWLTYDWKFYLPILFTYFIHSPPSPCPGKAIQSLFFVSESVSFVCLLCFSVSPYKWNQMVFVFLWLISLSIILSRSTCVVRSDKISFLSYGWAIFYFVCVCVCVYTASSLSMSLLMDTLRLLPYLIYNK